MGKTIQKLELFINNGLLESGKFDPVIGQVVSGQELSVHGGTEEVKQIQAMTRVSSQQSGMKKETRLGEKRHGEMRSHWLPKMSSGVLATKELV